MRWKRPAAADRQLGLGVRGGAAVLLVFGVLVLGAWITISSGSGAPAVREAELAVREQILTSLYARGRPAVAVFVLANDPHRAAVCTAPGQARFPQEDSGRWKDEGKATPTAWAQTLVGACPYVP
jgi:hypothetical protein